MSCRKPLVIKNPVKNFDPLADKYQLEVSCNKCDKCRQNNRVEWQTRIHFEYINARSLGGFTSFVTLTYHRSRRPRVWSLKDKNGDPVYCFSKEHLKSFIKKLQMCILRKGVFTLRYFVSTEFGEDKREYIDYKGNLRVSEHAPHYHCLFFLVPNGSHNFSTSDVLEFNELVKSKWNFGLSDFGKDKFGRSSVPGLVVGEGPVGYCAKYVNKDINSDEYFNDIRELLKNSGKTDVSIEKMLLNCKCFHIQSTYFGACAFKYVKKDLLDNGVCEIPFYNDSGKVVLKVVRLPLYLDRKLNYTQVSNVSSGDRSYVLTSEGVERKVKQKLILRDKLNEELNSFIDNYKQNFNADVIKYINEKLGTSYLSSTSVYNDLLSSLAGMTISQLVDYYILFKDLPIKFTNGHYVFNTIFQDLIEICDYKLDLQTFTKIVRRRLSKDRSSGVVPKDFDNFTFNQCLRETFTFQVPSLNHFFDIFKYYKECINNSEWKANQVKYDLFKRTQALFRKHA